MKSNSICEYCEHNKVDGNWEFCIKCIAHHVYDFQGVDVLTITEVARLFTEITDDYPCLFIPDGFGKGKNDFCKSCFERDIYECWENAIRWVIM